MGRCPTTETVEKDFGLESFAFLRGAHALRDAWESARGTEACAEHFRSWSHCLADAYGTAVASDDLFIRQTYLATVAKLFARHRIGRPESCPAADEITRIIDGTYFLGEGIPGLRDGDFFSWIAEPRLKDTSRTVVQLLWDVLHAYDLDQLSEDVLKSLYEHLVDPEPRHDLGEYYTPDWMAARMVRRLMDENPRASFLDPACGSGSFLYAVIREKRVRLGDSAETLVHVITAVSGMDINPLAVLVAKTNYLLALGDLISTCPKPLEIPIHLTDSLSFRHCDVKSTSPLNPQHRDPPSPVPQDMPYNGNQMFDVVVGNPPWISYRFMDPARQRVVRDLVLHEYGLLEGRSDLITHMEMATLFLLRSSELYAKPGGTISFVLPRSIFSADQHHGLRTGGFSLGRDTELSLSWKEIWDCQNVVPLFDVPSCVLTAEKAVPSTVERPVYGEILSGDLSRRNASLEEAEQSLTVEPVQYYLHRVGRHSYLATDTPIEHSGASPYTGVFSQGASMVPRSFWFVDVMSSQSGADYGTPLVATSAYARSQARSAYKDVALIGTVESRFLYGTLLAADVLPFGHLAFRTVLLPIKPTDNRYRILDAESARTKGLLHVAQWLEGVEREWQRRRGRKAAGVSALEWLDYRGKLTRQNPRSRCRVIYNTSGTYLTAAVVNQHPVHAGPWGGCASAEAYVADTKTYYYETDDADEAHYLAAVLNAPTIDRLIKPLQSRGAFGPRDIHKKVFELPIPRYDDQPGVHRRLAGLGRECSIRVREWLAELGPGETRSIGRLRARIRALLDAELKELDRLIPTILT